MRISDWSSDVCSSDLHLVVLGRIERDALLGAQRLAHVAPSLVLAHVVDDVEEREEEGVAGDGSDGAVQGAVPQLAPVEIVGGDHLGRQAAHPGDVGGGGAQRGELGQRRLQRSEEHTSELKSLMRTSYAV